MSLSYFTSKSSKKYKNYLLQKNSKPFIFIISYLKKDKSNNKLKRFNIYII